MKEYAYKEITRKVNYQKHSVIIPKKHSTIEALIYETKDLNAWDDWANITDWHTLCMVLRKGAKEWETLHDGRTRTFKINSVYIGFAGIYNILFQLESEKVRNNYLKKKQIKELEDRIKKDTKRLQILKKVK